MKAPNGMERANYYLSVNVHNEEELSRFMDSRLVDEFFTVVTKRIIERQIRSTMPCWVYCLEIDDVDDFWNSIIRRDLLERGMPIAITKDKDYRS